MLNNQLITIESRINTVRFRNEGARFSRIVKKTDRLFAAKKIKDGKTQFKDDKTQFLFSAYLLSPSFDDCFPECGWLK